EITRAIQRSKVMVLIFSAYSNTSEQVLREVQLAANSHLHIVQFRIADVLPNDDLEYYLSTPHWLDALTPPLEGHLGRLQTSIKGTAVPAASAASSPAVVSAAKTGISVPPPQGSASVAGKPAGFLGVRGGNSLAESALIETIVPDSPAEEAHLQKGDVIRKFNGRAIKNFPELRSFIGQTELHKRIDLEFEREGKPMQVSTELRV